MNKPSLSVHHLLDIRTLPVEDIKILLETAKSFKEILQRPNKKVPALRDVCVANLFFENSTRTRISFELAEKRLSADTINFSASGSSVKKGETLLDTVNNILAMKVDMIVIRHEQNGAPHFLSQHIDVPIINAGDGTHEHPTQGLLDAFSLLEKFGNLTGLKVAIIGDILHSRVARSNIYLLKKMGAEITVCGPPTLIPNHIHELGVQVSYNMMETLQWCDCANFLRIQLERQNIKYIPSLREYSYLYGLDAQKFKSLQKNIVILHPGPINRGVELSSDMADSEHAMILNQVENGVAMRMAVLYLLGQKNKISSN